MGIREVSEQTGLSEKKIRLYITEGLIQPQMDETGENYFFTEEEILRLKDIAYLSDSHPGIERMREMLNHPLWIPGKPEESRKKIEEAQMKHPPKVKKTVRRGFLILFLLGIFGFSWYMFNREGRYLGMVMYAAFFGIMALISLVMTVRYANMRNQAKKLPCQGQGTVVAVVEERGFHVAYSRAGMNYSGVREPGLPGVWQFFFLFWNEVRLDCWFPIIELKDEKGENRFGTYHYSGWKHSWKEGEQVKVAWNEKNPDDLYPVTGKWVRGKWLAYFGLTVLLLIISLGCYWGRTLPFDLQFPTEADRAVICYEGTEGEIDSDTYREISFYINEHVIRRKWFAGSVEEPFLTMEVYQEEKLPVKVQFDREGRISVGEKQYEVSLNENQIIDIDLFLKDLEKMVREQVQ